MKRASFYLIGLLFLVGINLPYVFLYWHTPAGHEYTGIGLNAVSDKLVYYAMAHQGADGNIWMINPHTTELQTPSLFSPQWWLVGQVSRIGSMGIPLAFHLVRTLLAVVLIGAVWSICQRLFDTFNDRLVAFGTVLFGAGLGWIYTAVRPDAVTSGSMAIPVDAYVTEFQIFSNAVQSPLFVVAHALLLLSMYWFVRGYLDQRRVMLVGSLVSAVVLVLMHPYDGVILLSVLGTWSVWRVWAERKLSALGVFAIIVLTVAVAYGYVWQLMLSQYAIAGWLQQNQVTSPAVPWYLWGLGITAPLWVVGVREVWRTYRQHAWWQLVVGWSVVFWPLVYLPVSVNRRFSNAAFVPFVCLAVLGSRHIYQRIKPYAIKMTLVVLAALGIFGGTVASVALAYEFTPSLDEKYAYYLDASMTEFVAYAQKNFSTSTVVASNEPFIAMLTSAYSGAKLYVGHEHQTVQYLDKFQKLQRFMQVDITSDAEAEKRIFMERNGVGYLVVYVPTLPDAWLGRVSWLRLVYHNDRIQVYEYVAADGDTTGSVNLLN